MTTDDIVSIDRAMDLMEKLEYRHQEKNFLSDGLTLEEKNRIHGKS